MLIDKEKLIEVFRAMGTEVEVGRTGDTIVARPKTIAIQQVINIIEECEE